MKYVRGNGAVSVRFGGLSLVLVFLTERASGARPICQTNFLIEQTSGSRPEKQSHGPRMLKYRNLAQKAVDTSLARARQGATV